VSSPGNCPGVAAVAAIRHAGSKVGFSSLGPEVALSAPGGNCVNVNGGPCLFSLDTTSNSGATVPATHTFTNQINSNLGTSFSAPIVSGIAALMLSRNANLSTSQLLARLREGARPFPTTVADDPTITTVCHVPANDQDFQLAQCLCTTSTCGAGMANAANSIAAADRPIAAVALPVNVAAGQNVLLNAAASAAACGRTITSYAWIVTAPAVNPPAIVGANTSSATVIAPSSGSITLRLMVTDSQNRTDTADVQVESDRASTAAPSTAGSTPCAVPVTSGPTPGSPTPTPTPAPTPTPTPPKGGGGGGSIGATTLFLLVLLGSGRTRRRRASHFSRCI
jgi:serine protease